MFSKPFLNQFTKTKVLKNIANINQDSVNILKFDNIKGLQTKLKTVFKIHKEITI